MEFSKYTIYSKYVNAAMGTTSCNYKISSSASLFEPTQPTDTHELPSLHHDNNRNLLWVRWLKTGKDTLHKQWEGRSGFIMEPNSAQQLIYTIMSPIRALPKQRRNEHGGRGYLCLSTSYCTSFIQAELVASHGDIKKSQRNNRRQKLPQMKENVQYPVLQSVCTWPQAEGTRRSGLEPVRGFKHIYKKVYVQIFQTAEFLVWGDGGWGTGGLMKDLQEKCSKLK